MKISKMCGHTIPRKNHLNDVSLIDKSLEDLPRSAKTLRIFPPNMLLLDTKTSKEHRTRRLRMRLERTHGTHTQFLIKKSTRE